ncbi:hypothetical protein PPYR_04522 [Photinus pyralis]|uniref:Uncharacterized protein n=2 Tax=Photinus pyralis TaxID=7054 RepID=A0A5N4AHC7_PHOPY|nr:ras-related protein ced-10-like [Photinus pyralis]XP_031334236.1 ras-related protein ced-10-like [Photinus pyralis]XP_031348919.1 ras-related protein ced-10-like [Photinus pyralis]KAB0796714.1 hypothetical protein PPYR_10775 [Photinus pyralis]KAB0802336.1 hypothetical protein PPYR_04522 [Photinus pyralis]
MDRLKVVIVGDSFVGKTSFTMRLVNDVFPEKHVPTVSDKSKVDFSFEGFRFTIDVFDSAGGEDFHRLRHLLYPMTDLFFLCFALNDLTSYNNVVNYWLPELRHHQPSVPIILIGTKSDLEQTVMADCKSLMQSYPKVKILLRCSAKTASGVHDIVEAAVAICLRKRKLKQKKKCIIL